MGTSRLLRTMTKKMVRSSAIRTFKSDNRRPKQHVDDGAARSCTRLRAGRDLRHLPNRLSIVKPVLAGLRSASERKQQQNSSYRHGSRTPEADSLSATKVVRKSVAATLEANRGRVGLA